MKLRHLFLMVVMEMVGGQDAEPQYALASMYYAGHHGMRKDYRKARYWYRET